MAYRSAMSAAHRARLRAAAALAVLALAVTGCGGSSSPSTHGSSGSAAPPTATTTSTSSAPSTARTAYPTTALRRGEHFQNLALPAAYKPHAAVGTDDYRCFLIDPHGSLARHT